MTPIERPDGDLLFTLSFGDLFRLAFGRKLRSQHYRIMVDWWWEKDTY